MAMNGLPGQVRGTSGLPPTGDISVLDVGPHLGRAGFASFPKSRADVGLKEKPRREDGALPQERPGLFLKFLPVPFHEL